MAKMKCQLCGETVKIDTFSKKDNQGRRLIRVEPHRRNDDSWCPDSRRQLYVEEEDIIKQ